MSDVKRYVQNRAKRDPEFAENYDAGYADFKIGVVLRQAREPVHIQLRRLQRAQFNHVDFPLMSSLGLKRAVVSDTAVRNQVKLLDRGRRVEHHGLRGNRRRVSE